MFIGTADDRYLRPHAFYQVHRITGKTVATASQEILVSCTKVLEIPLLPENNMSARYVSEVVQPYIEFITMKDTLLTNHFLLFLLVSYRVLPNPIMGLVISLKKKKTDFVGL